MSTVVKCDGCGAIHEGAETHNTLRASAKSADVTSQRRRGPAMPNAKPLRELRADAVAQGLCGECRCRPQKPGCSTCQTCLDARYTRRAAYVAVGLCPCGRERERETEHENCAACRARMRERYAARSAAQIAAGLCRNPGCRHRPEPDRESCARHLKRDADRMRRYYAKHMRKRAAARGRGSRPTAPR